MQNVMYYFYVALWNSVVSYLLFSVCYVCFLSLFLSSLFNMHRKNLRKAGYQTSIILLSLAITIEAVVFTSTNQKILTFCNFAIFFSRFFAFFVTSISLTGIYDSLGPQFQFSRSIFLKLYQFVNFCQTHYWHSSVKMIKVYKVKL